MQPEDRDLVTPIEHQLRAIELKQEVAEVVGGEMMAGEMAECPPEVEVQFWEQVLDYEKAPWTTHFDELREIGYEPPPPDTLDDAQLSAELQVLARRLAQIRVFLECTNHLSDRELYTYLYEDGLRHEVKVMPRSENSGWHLDLVSSGSEEDIHLWLKHYADEESRRDWAESWPDYQMPEREVPPYDRDRFLPQRFGPPEVV